jgi:acyl carrier protein|tara:strand:- start:630 stop:884 length:255 start_codon:yes stop_codon:yes gene_type:complete
MSANLQNRLNELIAAVFSVDVSDIRDDRGPHDIQAWDSLGQLNLILQIENEFEVTFDIEDVFGFFTVGDVYRSLLNKVRLSDDE